MTDTVPNPTDVARCPVAHGTDFTDPDLVQRAVPLPEFAWLRQNKPMYWNPTWARKNETSSATC